MNKKNILMIVVLVVLSLMIIGGYYSNRAHNEEPSRNAETGIYECPSDAKICSDGSIVRQVGTDCQFSPCPASDVDSATLTTSLGQKTTGLSLSITPKEVVSDSRCAVDVQCVWQGSIEVRTMVESATEHSEHVFTMNEPFIFGEFLITLIEVTPAPHAGEAIPDASYRFVFRVKRN